MRQSLSILLAVSLLLASTLAGGAWAHSLYIQSGRHMVNKGKASPLFFCYGHHIPVDDAVRSEKLAYVRVLAPDGEVREIELREGKSLHSYLVDYDMEGTWVLIAETTPGFFTTWYDQRDRKRHAIAPMSTVADEATRIENSMRSSQWAKSYVCCETCSEDFPAFVGLPLELVPARDVFLVEPGETLDFQVYMDGEPYSGEGFYDATYMGFSVHSEDMYIPRTEVSDGTFRFPVDVAGRWFVRFYTKTEAPEEQRSEYLQEKRTTTLVFEVPGERRRPEIDSH
ncbi:MAG: DUF4198 domain-containing protein [Desulfovibrio sp.]|nr:MAG: DUF4198 domain-containing protein [Desulfovibrio sp.]